MRYSKGDKEMSEFTDETRERKHPKPVRSWKPRGSGWQGKQGCSSGSSTEHATRAQRHQGAEHTALHPNTSCAG